MLTTLPHSTRQVAAEAREPVARLRPKAAFVLDPASHALIFAKEDIARLVELCDLSEIVIPGGAWENHRPSLADVEVIFSGWGAPCMDEHFLAAAPRLRAVFYGAGSIRRMVTTAFWDRGIVVTSAYAANAVPVAEYTLGATLLSLRDFWARAAAARLGQGWGDHTRPIPGSFRAVVGLLSFGMIARKVAEHLRHFDVRVIVCCPFLTEAEAAERGVKKVSIDELFALSDVVSVHTPLLPETTGLVTGPLVAAMKRDATLINTARGPVLAQREVVAVLRERLDLRAILDVTDPEPPLASDPLFTLPNVTVTSHIAGSHGRDCQRMGHYMVQEFAQYLHRLPLRWEITRETLRLMA